MSKFEEVLATQQRSVATAVRFANVESVPDDFLTVVNRYGDPMSSPSDVLTLSHRQSQAFSRDFAEWLADMSKTMADMSLNEAASLLRSDSKFEGRFYIFESLTEFALWYAKPENEKLDAFIPYFIANGFPIYGVSIFTDRA